MRSLMSWTRRSKREKKKWLSFINNSGSKMGRISSKEWLKIRTIENCWLRFPDGEQQRIMETSIMD